MANFLNKYYWARLYLFIYLILVSIELSIIDLTINLDWVQDPESCKYINSYFILIAYEATF